MTQFIFLLSLYYQCDAAAAQMALSPEDARRCMSVYSAVKAEFAGDDTSNPHAGFLAFKDWEQANSDLVSDLRTRGIAG